MRSAERRRRACPTKEDILAREPQGCVRGRRPLFKVAGVGHLPANKIDNAIFKEISIALRDSSCAMPQKISHYF